MIRLKSWPRPGKMCVSACFLVMLALYGPATLIAEEGNLEVTEKTASVDNQDTTPARTTTPSDASTVSITSDELLEFESQPQAVKDLINAALDLTAQGLTYTYASDDPAKGGMDCSGTIYYLLKAQNIDGIPRSSHRQYRWAWKSGKFYPVFAHSAKTFELDKLRPGALLFWTGTYKVDRDPAVSHVMIYLGTLKRDGRPVMAGASDGRSYAGKPRNGVSVFDFHFPLRGQPKEGKRHHSRFIGYANIL